MRKTLTGIEKAIVEMLDDRWHALTGACGGIPQRDAEDALRDLLMDRRRLLGQRPNDLSGFVDIGRRY